MKIMNLVLLIGLLLAFSNPAFAQGVIANRSALDALLGSSRADEGFETLPIADGGSVGSDGLLSSTNSWGGNGLNLVVPGVTFESTGTGGNYTIQWSGNGFGPGSTKTVNSYVGLLVDFWNPTLAFGIDLKDYPTTRTVLAAGITVYGPDDFSIIYQNDAFDITSPASGTFFGFENPLGIGSVVFTTALPGPFNNNQSAFIDNLSFSTAPIPEPSTLALGLLGLSAFALRRFRQM